MLGGQLPGSAGADYMTGADGMRWMVLYNFSGKRSH